MANLKQKKVLNKFSKYKVTEKHSDGDLTFRANGKSYVLTTTGRMFKEVK